MGSVYTAPADQLTITETTTLSGLFYQTLSFGYSTHATTTLSTAAWLGRLIQSPNAAAGGHQTQNVVANISGYGELTGLGGSPTWNSLGAIPAPTGNGWLFDSALLEGMQLIQCSGHMEIRITTQLTGNITADIWLRLYKYNINNLTYSLIVQTTMAGTVIANNNAFATYGNNVTYPQTNFNTGDRLYLDCWPNVTADTAGANNIRIGDDGNQADGSTNTAHITGLTFSPQNVADSLTTTETSSIQGLSTASDQLTSAEVLSLSGLATVTDSLTLSEISTRLGQNSIVDRLTTTETSSLSSLMTTTDQLTGTEVLSLSGLATVTDTLSLSETSSLSSQISPAADQMTITDTLSLQGMMVNTDQLTVQETLTLLDLFLTTAIQPFVGIDGKQPFVGIDGGRVFSGVDGNQQFIGLDGIQPFIGTLDGLATGFITN